MYYPDPVFSAWLLQLKLRMTESVLLIVVHVPNVVVCSWSLFNILALILLTSNIAKWTWPGAQAKFAIHFTHWTHTHTYMRTHTYAHTNTGFSRSWCGLHALWSECNTHTHMQALAAPGAAFMPSEVCVMAAVAYWGAESVAAAICGPPFTRVRTYEAIKKLIRTWEINMQEIWGD